MADIYSGNNETYQSLVDTFGRERIEDRYSFLFLTANEFLGLNEINVFFQVSKNLIREILIDYFSDILRLKDFHDIERINPIKVAAYTAYWVWRRHPIQQIAEFPIDTLKNAPFLSIINEWYAFDLMISMMYNKEIPFLLAAEELKTWNDFAKNIVYSLTYRTITPHYLESALTALRARNCFAEL
ncbi:MAG: hypothetical protein A2Y33_15805 [Spirochaetes bacterium GWF1_51_8]|nr:MAG: hypothetical protein A2Y33_15805 [Spirochaetes bacterium GWF1_51_8]